MVYSPCSDFGTVSRPCKGSVDPEACNSFLTGGETPTYDLVMGYNRSNTSPWLKRLLVWADELVRNVQKQISLR